MFDNIKLAQSLERDNYEYTFSMTIKTNATSCTTRNPIAASLFCNIFLVDEVFMVYFETINTLRVYFFADKNFYESASKSFFIPSNQWVTLQLVFARFDGFDLVVADQNNQIFYRETQSNKNMQQMFPLNKASLFSSFDGYVDHVMLCPSKSVLGQNTIQIERTKKNCIFNTGFSEDYLTSKGQIKNTGTNENFNVTSSQKYDLNFFQGKSSDPASGTFKAQPLFDGIACDDDHLTVNLSTKDSFFRFNTPSFNMWQSESTVEFWFKIKDPTVYSSPDKFSILSMRDIGGKYPYYEIYVQNGVLYCAPFGSASINDQRMAFPQFTKANEDQFGWWHVSCSYAFQKLARATLFNTNISAYQTLSLIGQSNFYPQDSLLASFGLPTNSSPTKTLAGLLIKEVRYWSVQRTQDQISLSRYNQLDPTLDQYTGKLLTYLRLASGVKDFRNFADTNRRNAYDKTTFQYNGITLVSDYFDSVTYFYDQAKRRVLPRTDRSYHTVCPLSTYYLDQFCYSEPINQLELTIFPVWNSATKSVDWELSLLHSSAIQASIITTLEPQWQTEDDVLQAFFDAQPKQFSYIVPMQYLRHEAEYDISVQLTNEQKTFQESKQVRFVPSKCAWFISESGDASSAYKVFGSPGIQDISFTLQRKSNSGLDCSSFNFFNQIDKLDFAFMLLDTNEFIQFTPEITYKLTPSGDLTLNLSSSQQVKLPLFTDIQMIVSIHWKNAKFEQKEKNNLVFQHVMVTMKFAPSDSTLNANLIASSSNVIRDENLILDASSSYISNVPERIKNKGIQFEWQCPKEFSAICLGQTDSQLLIPFSYVSQLQLKNTALQMFQRQFTFTVIVSWDNPNSGIEVDKLSAQVMWWDIQKPQFIVTYSPQPVLITDVKNTVFTISNANFDVTDIADFTVYWQLDPQLKDMNQATVLQQGALFQVNKGSWSADTSYTVTATISHKALDQLSKSQTVSFSTKAAPHGGSVIVSPQSAPISAEISVSIDGWQSENPPVVFNVYSTLDANGLRRGLLLNVGAPVSSGDKFKFTLKNGNPIQVEVTDQSRETIQFLEFIQVTQSEAINTEDQTPDALLGQLRKSTDVSEKVTLMDNILSTSLQSAGNNPAQMTFLLDTTSQQLIRLSLLQAIADQISIFKSKPGSQDMTVEDFILKTMPLIRNALSVAEFIDTKTGNLSTSVVDQLILLKQSVFFELIQTSLQLRDDYIGVLQNLNAFARTNNNDGVQTWIIDRVTALMNRLCTFATLDPSFKTQDSSEMEFQLYQFDKEAAKQNKKTVMQALDSEFNLATFSVYSSFPTTHQPDKLCAQVLSIRDQQTTLAPKRQLAINKLNPYSKGFTSVTFFEPNMQQTHQLGEIIGTRILNFDVVPETFKNNQTVCMAFSKISNTWDADLCNTEIEVNDRQLKCSCNAFKSELTAVFTDPVRVFDTNIIQFPQLKTTVETDATNQLQQRTKSNAWLISSCLLSFVLLAAAGIAFRLDISDKHQKMQQQEQIQEFSFFSQSSGGLNHFILEVSRELHQPYAEVEFRRQNLMTYRNVCQNSVFVHVLAQMHPIVSPFISYFATQSRLLRFSAYLLQINFFSCIVAIYFNPTSYRAASIRYNDSAIDQLDIKNIVFASCVGSLILIPIVSEPLCSLLSNVITRVVHSDANYADEIQVEVKRRRVAVQNIVIAAGNFSSVIVPIWAGIESGMMPASNQYCILMTTFCGLLGAMFITSIFFVGYNSFIAKCMLLHKCGRFTFSHWFVSHKALQIAQDVKAVQEVSKLFTLSDVLPSSLENSIRSIQVRKPQQDNSSDGIDDIQSHQTNSEKYKDSNRSNPGLEDSSNRNLNSHTGRQRRGRMPRNSEAHQKHSLEESNSLTYTEYKTKLGVVDGLPEKLQNQPRHNNYIRDSVSQEKADESNETIAYNVNESVHEQESSADFAQAERSRNYLNEQEINHLSRDMGLYNSRPDVSRNDILPIKGIGSDSAHSDFSDIRPMSDNQSSSNSSLPHEVKVYAADKKSKVIRA